MSSGVSAPAALTIAASSRLRVRGDCLARPARPGPFALREPSPATEVPLTQVAGDVVGDGGGVARRLLERRTHPASTSRVGLGYGCGPERLGAGR